MQRTVQVLFSLAGALLLISCGVARHVGEAESASPSAAIPMSATATFGALNSVEVWLTRAEAELQASAWAPFYNGGYISGDSITIIVAAHEQDIRKFLIDAGVPPTILFVVQGNQTLAALQQAEAAAWNWLPQFPGGGMVTIDVPANRVLIALERQPLIDMIQYDPGDAVVPYERWPLSLQQAMTGIVPGVRVDVVAGFRTTPMAITSEAQP